ncbi:MAG: YihY/virulence factor BrkB family protein [Defluviimonas sp.]|uniref:YihY/virulence factor BrkB family protein n=1 Tax=Albidovulum sp. TaxID=1872424 RepID=UPI002A350704|nr:YihY/virulence factor BrkB family protein [Defluviimonas sp.]
MKARPRYSQLALLRAVWDRAGERNIGLVAAGVAYYALFALFPGMAALFAIWGFFADPVVMRDYLVSLHGAIPDMIYTLVESQLDALLGATAATLGWATAVSLGLALYAVHNGVAALVSGLNAVHGPTSAPVLARLLRTILITLALIVVALMALATVVAVPIALNFFPHGMNYAFVLRYLPWTILLTVVFSALGLFYRWGVDPLHRPSGWFTPGTLLATLLWAAASLAFSAYLSNFNTYNRIYGSIGAVAALLVWFYISAYIVLLGALLDSERRRLRDQ